MRKGLVGLVVLAITAVTYVIAPPQAWAWKPPSHLYGVEAALTDALDGTVSIPHVAGGSATDVGVNATIRQALQEHPAAYRAGAVGPDAFPDTFFGQMAIHPDTRSENGTRPPAAGRNSETHEWLGYLWEQAWNPATPEPQRLQNIAFALGYMGGHANGDTWAHTWVNDYAGGVFPDFSDLSASDISLRHLVVEGYVDKHRPGYEDHTAYDVAAPRGFIADTLILSDFARQHGSSPFYDFFLGMRDTLVVESDALHHDSTTQDFIGDCPVCVPDPTDSPVNLIELGIDLLLEAYLDAWVADIDTGLRNWVGVWETIAKELFAGKKANADAVFDALKAWALQDFLAMMGLPDFIGEGIYLVGTVIDFVRSLITGVLDLVFDTIKAIPVVGDLVEYVEGLYDKAADFIRGKIADVVDHLAGIFITMALGLTDLNPVTRDAIDHNDDGLVTPREVIRVIAEPEEYVREPLFPAGARARLDADMQLTDGVDQDDAEVFRDYSPSGFAPLFDTTVMAKMAMLDEHGLNALVRTRAGGPSSALADLYGSHGNASGSWAVPNNVMLGWGRSIDAEYQWRTTSPNDGRSYGTGRMWLWEDCVSRDRVFRTSFRNPVQTLDGFTDAGDPPTGITDSVAPTSALALSGPVVTSGGTTYVSGSTTVTISATDNYFAKPDLRISTRRYAASEPAPAYGPGEPADLAPFTLSGADGAHVVQHFARDDRGRCNTEAERSRTLVLDTTPPVITVSSPTPPGPADHLSDAILPLAFTADDGSGSGVDESTAAHYADGVRQPGPPGSVDLFDYPAGTHEYRAEVADGLGNLGQALVPWRTVVSHTSLQSNLLKAWAERGCISTESTYHSLLVKLRNAQAADERGNDGASDHALQAFVNEIALRAGALTEPGRTISPTCAAILTTNATWLQNA